MWSIDTFELINKGGLLVWPILFCSLLGTTIFFERLLKYRRIFKYHETLDRVYLLVQDGNLSAAEDLLSEHSAINSIIDKFTTKHDSHSGG